MKPERLINYIIDSGQSPTASQVISYMEIVERYGYEPAMIYTAFAEKCLMMQYHFITIGIEPNGYAHS